MNVLDIILSLEVMAGILITASLAMAVRSLLHFTRESATMGPKLQKIDAELQKWREGMGDRERAVKKLSAVVEPLAAREGRMRAYYETLRNIELERERETEKAGQEQEAAKKKRIQRKKMGLDEK